jgi:hypothetical protein
MNGAIPPFPQYIFIAWCSVKAQGLLYLYLKEEKKLHEGEKIIMRNFTICTLYQAMLN